MTLPALPPSSSLACSVLLAPSFLYFARLVHLGSAACSPPLISAGLYVLYSNQRQRWSAGELRLVFLPCLRGSVSASPLPLPDRKLAKKRKDAIGTTRQEMTHMVNAMDRSYADQSTLHGEDPMAVTFMDSHNYNNRCRSQMLALTTLLTFFKISVAKHSSQKHTHARSCLSDAEMLDDVLTVFPPAVPNDPLVPTAVLGETNRHGWPCHIITTRPLCRPPVITISTSPIPRPPRPPLGVCSPVCRSQRCVQNVPKVKGRPVVRCCVCLQVDGLASLTFQYKHLQNYDSYINYNNTV